MNVFDAMKGRQSIRKFRKDPVPREQILRMVEAATWAPSAGNTQNVRFLVVEDPALLSRMKGIVDEILARVTGKEIPPGKINYHNLFPAAPAHPPRSRPGNRRRKSRSSGKARFLEPEPLDPEPLGFGYRDPVPVRKESHHSFRNVLEAVQREAARGLVGVPQGDIDPVLVAENPDRRRGGHRQRPVLLPLRDLGGFPPLR